MIRTTGVAAFMLLALAGCASTGDGGGPRGGGEGMHSGGSGCNASQRVCTISVTFCKIDDPGDLVVKDRDVDVLWKVEHGMAGYFFEVDGIEIKGAGDQFGRPSVQQEGSVIRIRDANSLPGEHKYKYTIRVKSRTLGPCPPLDPTIINQG
jgi:hypothetical protein